MTVPGFIDRAANRQRAKAEFLERYGDDFEPPDGWDAFFGPDNPICDVRCQQCGEMVPEVRPFGANHESICEACAAKDPQTTSLRYLGLNPDA